MSISQNYPTISPSLDLSFALTKKLDPRISFSRPTVGGYYDGKTVAKAEENLVKFSGDLTNAVWEKSINGSATTPIVTAGQTDPAGGSTAFRIQATRLDDSSASLSVIQQSLPSAAPKTNSIWIKSNTGVSQSVCFGFTVETAITATTDWQRLSIFTTNISFASTFRIGTRGAVNTDQSVDILVWQPQSEQRSAVTAYTPTTTQPITNYIPTLLSAPANVARFDHNPVTGESLGLLVEEQRTNLLLRSEEFDDAAWASANLINDPNAIIAPDGNLTADGIIENTVSGIHAKSQFPITTIASASYTISVFAKEKIGSKRYLRLSLNSNATNSLWSAATYDLATGEVTSSNGAGGGTVTSTGITPVGNGWFRCVLTGNIGANTDMFAGVSLSSVPTTYTANSRGRQAYLGDGYSGIFIWGAQLEAKQKASSYIKTEASQVTRSAELPSMTGANFTSWFSQGEGTLYVEAQLASTTGRLGTLSVDGNALANGILLDINSGNFRTEGFYNSSGQWAISSAGYVASTDVKQAIVYQTNNVALFANGSQRSSTDVSALIPNDINRFEIGGFGNAKANGHIRKIAFYPKALSATELQALTS